MLALAMAITTLNLFKDEINQTIAVINVASITIKLTRTINRIGLNSAIVIVMFKDVIVMTNVIIVMTNDIRLITVAGPEAVGRVWSEGTGSH